MKNLSKFTGIMLFILTMTPNLFAQTAPGADAIAGVFINADGNRKMEIYKENDHYFSKMNADADGLKSGTIILKNLVFSKGKWNGKIYVPAQDKDFDVTLTLTNQNSLEIKVKAGMMSRSKTWTRVQ